MTESPKHLTVGGRTTLTIQDLAFGGEGVGRWEDFVVFVPFVLPGETVEVELFEVKKRFARARLLKVLSPAPDRVQPECRYFGECGGCQYQHIAYPAQLELKRKQITDLFQRIGGFPNPVVLPVEPSPRAYGYRNRIMIRSQWNKPEQRLNVGYLRWDNRLVVDVEECPIAEPALSEQIRRVRAEPPPKGGLKVTLRMAPEGWELPPDSFFQNNLFLLPKLVETVRDCLHQSGARCLVDAYCGVGFFSVELAGLVEAFLGVEVDPLAVQAARRNAAHHRRRNGEFYAGRTEDLLPDILRRFPAEKTAMILDPPRAGCPRPSLERLRRAGLRQIIYVSCHPATLARDLNVLCAGDVFKLLRVIPLDMFPQTQHVECVADLRQPNMLSEPSTDTGLDFMPARSTARP